MKKELSRVKASHACSHPFCANRITTKVVIAPNPMLLNASPIPGTQTALTTLVNDAHSLLTVCTGARGRMNAEASNGSATVATATASNPMASKSTVPRGAPTA